MLPDQKSLTKIPGEIFGLESVLWVKVNTAVPGVDDELGANEAMICFHTSVKTSHVKTPRRSSSHS